MTRTVNGTGLPRSRRHRLETHRREMLTPRRKPAAPATAYGRVFAETPGTLAGPFLERRKDACALRRTEPGGLRQRHQTFMRAVGRLQPPTGPSRVIAPSGFYVLLQEAVICPVANRPLQLLPMVFRLPEDKRFFMAHGTPRAHGTRFAVCRLPEHATACYQTFIQWNHFTWVLVSTPCTGLCDGRVSKQ